METVLEPRTSATGTEVGTVFGVAMPADTSSLPLGFSPDSSPKITRVIGSPVSAMAHMVTPDLHPRGGGRTSSPSIVQSGNVLPLSPSVEGMPGMNHLRFMFSGLRSFSSSTTVETLGDLRRFVERLYQTRSWGDNAPAVDPTLPMEEARLVGNESSPAKFLDETGSPYSFASMDVSTDEELEVEYFPHFSSAESTEEALDSMREILARRGAL